MRSHRKALEIRAALAKAEPRNIIAQNDPGALIEYRRILHAVGKERPCGVDEALAVQRL